jgi:hypothetical protein
LKKLFYLIGTLLVAGLLLTLMPGLSSSQDEPLPASNIKKQATSRQGKDTLLLMGVGDLMLGSNYPSPTLLPPNDGRELLQAAAPLLQSADIAFGNLEGVIMTGKGTAKHCNDERYCYVFKSPDHYAKLLTSAGLDVVSIANNHTSDFGPKGREHTVQVLKKEGLYFAGHLEHPYSLFEKEGVRYGFCAFAPNTGTLSVNDTDEAIALIKMLNDSCDILMVSMHIGAEGTKYNHVTRQKELFLGENRGDPYHFARLVIDAGADIVWGHGPHVVRAVDLYKDRFIAYSLGNFATYGTINVGGINGYAPLVAVETDRAGRFISGQIHSFLQEKGHGPREDTLQHAAKEIKRLTSIDFPESTLSIENDGKISRKQSTEPIIK